MALSKPVPAYYSSVYLQATSHRNSLHDLHTLCAWLVKHEKDYTWPLQDTMCLWLRYSKKFEVSFARRATAAISPSSCLVAATNDGHHCLWWLICTRKAGTQPCRPVGSLWSWECGSSISRWSHFLVAAVPHTLACVGAHECVWHQSHLSDIPQSSSKHLRFDAILPT